MKKHALVFTISFVTALTALPPSEVYASGGRNACEILFAEGSKTPGKSALDLVQQKDFAGFWRKSIEAIKSAKTESVIGSDKIESWVLSHFFFDRIELAATNTREYAALIALWDQEGFASPFLPFKKTFNKTLENAAKPSLAPKGQISLKGIAEIHQSMMSGVPEIKDVKSGDLSWLELVKSRALFQWKNVEGIKNANIGRVRSVPVHFPLEAKAKSKTPKFINPLLASYRHEVKDEAGVTQSSNLVFYASLASVDQFLTQLSTPVQKAVETARKNNSLNDHNAILTEMVLTDLLNSAIAKHNADLAKAKNLDERVEVHAEFVWKFISIHPFINGNGRTARALLGQLLMQEGLLPPLLKNQNDVTNSSGSYVEQVKEGIVLSNKFLDDIIWRANNGWEPTKTPVALLARLPQRIFFDTKQEEIGDAYADVDVYDFAQFLRMNESKNYLKTEHQLLKDYVAHLKRWTAYRVKTGEEYQVRFVPAEMQQAALEVDATDRIKWMTKKSLFYSSDLAWRGLALQSKQSVEQLLEIFVKPSNILLSMNSSNETSPAAIEQSVKKDFETFNQNVLDPKKYFDMADDHMKAEGSYPTSPLLSAAMTRAVADRFSKGFLTGEKSIMSQQGQLVVAALTPEFGTAYFNRLGPISKRLELGFISKYPRQMEIAIAGIMSPDSVMRVEYRDVKVLEVAENTGENIAGETKINSVTILERNPVDPAIIKVTVQSEEGEVRSQRRFKMALVNERPVFTEIK